MINNMIRIHIRNVLIITSVLYFIEVKTKKASGLNIRRLFNAVVEWLLTAEVLWIGACILPASYLLHL